MGVRVVGPRGKHVYQESCPLGVWEALSLFRGPGWGVSLSSDQLLLGVPRKQQTLSWWGLSQSRMPGRQSLRQRPPAGILQRWASPERSEDRESEAGWTGTQARRVLELAVSTCSRPHSHTQGSSRQQEEHALCCAGEEETRFAPAVIDGGSAVLPSEWRPGHEWVVGISASLATQKL